MNSTELLIYLTDKQITRLFEIARKFPQDKLEWKPTPNNRTVLDILQEVATALQTFLPGIIARKVEWNPDDFAKWQAYRTQFKTVDELERLAKEGAAELAKMLRETLEADLSMKVEMPFPGEFNLADQVAYQYWNASYHEGQLTYILTMLEDANQ
jgi:uncharacterized damage-inducible protein DinB